MGVLKLSRISYFFYKKNLKILAKMIKNISRVVYCADIAYQVDIPTTCEFLHQGLGVVIHPHSNIGEYCIICQNVTIGASLGRNSNNKVPSIGNNVFIGAGSVLIGDIRVGNNVYIGANSVVLNDIPDNVVVAGVPATIKKEFLCEEKK